MNSKILLLLKSKILLPFQYFSFLSKIYVLKIIIILTALLICSRFLIKSLVFTLPNIDTTFELCYLLFIIFIINILILLIFSMFKENISYVNLKKIAIIALFTIVISLTCKFLFVDIINFIKPYIGYILLSFIKDVSVGSYKFQFDVLSANRYDGIERGESSRGESSRGVGNSSTFNSGVDNADKETNKSTNSADTEFNDFNTTFNKYFFLANSRQYKTDTLTDYLKKKDNLDILLAEALNNQKSNPKSRVYAIHIESARESIAAHEKSFNLSYEETKIRKEHNLEAINSLKKLLTIIEIKRTEGQGSIEFDKYTNKRIACNKCIGLLENDNKNLNKSLSSIPSNAVTSRFGAPSPSSRSSSLGCISVVSTVPQPGTFVFIPVQFDAPVSTPTFASTSTSTSPSIFIPTLPNIDNRPGINRILSGTVSAALERFNRNETNLNIIIPIFEDLNRKTLLYPNNSDLINEYKKVTRVMDKLHKENEKLSDKFGFEGSTPNN